MSDVRSSLYRDHRFPAEVIGHAVWLYLRFPLSLRMVEDLLAARGIVVSHETVRHWAEKFGRDFAGKIRRRAPRFGDKWHLDEVVITISGQKHWLWRAVDQDGFVLDALVQSRRDRRAAERLMRKLIRKRPALLVFWSPTSSDPMARRAGAWGSRLSTASTEAQQSCRKFASADAATRADHEAV